MSYLGGPLSSLAPELTIVQEKPDTIVVTKSNTMNFVVWFLGILVVVALGLWLIKPSFILKKTLAGELLNEINWFNVIIFSAVIALVAVLALYMLKR